MWLSLKVVVLGADSVEDNLSIGNMLEIHDSLLSHRSFIPLSHCLRYNRSLYFFVACDSIPFQSFFWNRLNADHCALRLLSPSEWRFVFQ